MNTIFKIISFFSTIILSILLVFSIFYIKSINTSCIDILKLYPKSSLKLYDKNDNLLKTEGLIKQTYVGIDKISINMKNAIISIEDNDFYKHNGINYKSIIRAFLKNIQSFSFKEGASTITQQLVKNCYLSNEKSINRKINEIHLSLKLEKLLTKDQILELYLNNILFGNRIYGIYEASAYYFNKEPCNLTIEESALLAGLIQLPNYYNPYNNYDEALKKRNLVINKMHELGYISDIDKFKSINNPIKLYKNEYKSYLEMYYDYLYEYIENNNISYDNKINIAINENIQKDIYNLFQNKTNLFKDDMQNAAVVVIDNSNCNVVAIGTNRNKASKVINYATHKLQPGSTIKPILDYAPAFEYLNMSPASIILDEPYKYSTGEKLNNWNNTFEGYISLRKALSTSRNIPALKLFQLVGSKRAFDFAKKLGLESLYQNESEAIGGAYKGYSLLDITSAYTAFSRNGYYKIASPIIKIDNKEYHTKEIKAMKDTTAFLINSILHDVFKNSTYDLNNTYLCAKTGQTNFDDKTKKKYHYNDTHVKDSLCIAYTKDLTVGVWTGYDNNKYALNSTSKDVSKKIMHYILSKYAKDNQNFTVPDNILYLKVNNIKDKLYLSNSGTYDYFIQGSQPLINETELNLNDKI